MPLPNFLIIGAPRCGTTTLYHTLGAHPDVYMSPLKEPLYWAVRDRTEPFLGPRDVQGIRRWEDYLRLFEGARAETCIGEASTLYLSSPEAARTIREALPGVRLVAVLRDPVERAYSHYLSHRRQRREPASDFAAALRLETDRRRAGWSPFWAYRSLGCYGEQLDRYLTLFPREQVGIFFYDDLVRDATAFVADLYGFLGMEAGPQDAPLVYNAAGLPRSRALHVLLNTPHWLRRIAAQLLGRGLRRLLLRVKQRNLARPSLPDAVRAELVETFYDDVCRVEQITGRDLTHWKRPGGFHS